MKNLNPVLFTKGKPMTFEEFRDTLLADPKVNRKLMNSRSPILELFFQAGKDSALTELNNQVDKMMDKRLLPCPFCGKEAKIITGYDTRAYFSIACTGCHVSLCQRSYDNSFQPSETKNGKKAILAWNTRTCSPEAGENRKVDCIAFYKWWNKQPGEDIAQGYDEWQSEGSS